MGKKILTYSPKDVIVLIGGFYQLEGYSSDTFISIVKDEKPFESQRAMDGEQARIYTKDEGYTVNLTLAQSSVSNNVLSAIYNIDAATQMGKFPLLIKDTKGSTTFFAGTAWIEQIPQVIFANELTVRTWTIATSEAGLNIGGNADNNLALDVLGIGSALLPVLKEFGVI